MVQEQIEGLGERPQARRIGGRARHAPMLERRLPPAQILDREPAAQPLLALAVERNVHQMLGKEPHLEFVAANDVAHD